MRKFQLSQLGGLGINLYEFAELGPLRGGERKGGAELEFSSVRLGGGECPTGQNYRRQGRGSRQQPGEGGK